MADFEGTLEECIAKFGEIAREYFKALHDESKKGIERFGAQMERDMVMAAPIGSTRQLMQGITHRTEETPEGEIVGKAGVPKEHPAGEYVIFVVCGTGRRGAASGFDVPADVYHPKYHSYNMNWPGMAANPFPYEVLKRNSELFKKIMRECRDKAIRRAVKG
jgi:hypothetical protein